MSSIMYLVALCVGRLLLVCNHSLDLRSTVRLFSSDTFAGGR